VKKTGYTAPPSAGRGEFSKTRIAIVATRWNTGIVDALVAGARRGLDEWGVPAKRIDEFHVPGAYEIPLAVEMLARGGRHAGVVALGAVIRGDTPHFEYVAGECARGLQDVALRHALPVGFGVLTVDTPAQAQARAGRGRDNKGYESAVAVLEMIRLDQELQQ
jgi:6,7-dimethyl-8-ribityllumazine synthase